MEELENNLYDYYTAQGKNGIGESLLAMREDALLAGLLTDVDDKHWRLPEDVTLRELAVAAAAVRARLEREHAADLED